TPGTASRCFSSQAPRCWLHETERRWRIISGPSVRPAPAAWARRRGGACSLSTPTRNVPLNSSRYLATAWGRDEGGHFRADHQLHVGQWSRDAVARVVSRAARQRPRRRVLRARRAVLRQPSRYARSIIVPPRAVRLVGG